MWTISGLLILVILHEAASGYVNSYNFIGGPCTYDEDCPTPNSYCKNHQACSCKLDHEYDQSSDVCFPTVIGTPCAEPYYCQRLKNSMCIDYQCKCGRDMVESQDKTSCLPLARISGSCQETQQCIMHTPHSHCNISTGVCDCDTRYHTAEGPPECLQDTGLDFPCNTTRECYIDSGHDQNALICTYEGSSNLKKCGCNEGFTREGSKCEKDGSVQTIASLITIVLCFLSSRL